MFGRATNNDAIVLVCVLLFWCLSFAIADDGVDPMIYTIFALLLILFIISSNLLRVSAAPAQFILRSGSDFSVNSRKPLGPSMAVDFPPILCIYDDDTFIAYFTTTLN